MLLVQLYLTLTLFRLKTLRRMCDLGKCLSISFRNVFATFVLISALGRVEPNYISWSVLSFAHILTSGFSIAYAFHVAARFKSVVIDRRNQIKFNFIKSNQIKRAKPYSRKPSCCNLCLAEKLCILTADKSMLLNKRSELITKCRHENKFYTANQKPDRYDYP